MAIPKLFVYHSKTSKSILLLRSKFKTSWEMILWDRATDTFTRGQWLCKKTIWPNGCSMSPDGTQFKYHYEIYGDLYGAYVVTSKVLHFTAIEFKYAQCGRWSVESFENCPIEEVGPCDVPEGYEFVEGAVHKNGEVIADFNNDVFVNVPPI